MQQNQRVIIEHQLILRSQDYALDKSQIIIQAHHYEDREALSDAVLIVDYGTPDPESLGSYTPYAFESFVVPYLQKEGYLIHSVGGMETKPHWTEKYKQDVTNLRLIFENFNSQDAFIKQFQSGQKITQAIQSLGKFNIEFDLGQASPIW